jgi:hypothetical protein
LNTVALGLSVHIILLTACSSEIPGTGADAKPSDSPPGAGVRWINYPWLFSSPQTREWVIIKCQLTDAPTIPAGLDTNIRQFFTFAGFGYGNIVDYFQDVSYNAVAVIATAFVGWIPAPFSSTDITAQNGRLFGQTKRTQRVKECAEAISADQLPDFEGYYGIIGITNVVNSDAGACSVGQETLTINGKRHNLACVWFGSQSFATFFAAHEIGHGLGLDHSHDNINSNCNGKPGEYCDPWDLMSAAKTYFFDETNWLVPGQSWAGPGLSTPNLLRMGWIPFANLRQFQLDGSEQTFAIHALSHPQVGEPLAVHLNIGGPQPFDGIYTVEYRQGDGWDQGFVSPAAGVGLTAPESTRLQGGTVLVHQFNPVGPPEGAATLIENAERGARPPGSTLVLTNPSGGPDYHVTVQSIDRVNGTATVSIGPGRTITTNAVELDVFWIGEDAAIATNSARPLVNKGDWNPKPFAITPPAASRSGSPLTAVTRLGGELDVFWIGPDGAIGTNWSKPSVNGGAWNPAPFPISPPNATRNDSALRAVARVDAEIHVFWIGADGAIGTNLARPGVNAGLWPKAPFAITPSGASRNGSPLTALVRPDGEVDVFWIGPDGAIGTNWSKPNVHGGAWNPAPFPITPPGASRNGSPLTAIVRPDGEVDVLWIGPDGAIGANWSKPSVNGGAWNPKPFPITPPGAARNDSALTAVTRLDGEVDVFWIGPDGAIGTNWSKPSVNGGAWNPTPFPITGPGASRTASPLTAVTRSDVGTSLGGEVDVFWIGVTGAIGTNWARPSINGGLWNVPFAISPANASGHLSSIASVSRQKLCG